MSFSTRLSILFLVLPGFALGQCLGDFDGSGFIDAGDSDVLMMLSSFTTDNAEADFNQSGIVDILDMLEFSLYSGRQCANIPESIDETSGRIQGLHLAVHHVHDEELTSDFLSIPAGSITYRLYVEVTDDTDVLLGIYGIDNAPLTWDATEPCYMHPLSSDMVGSINPVFFAIDPAMEYTSYMALGHDVDDFVQTYEYPYYFDEDDEDLFGSTHFELSGNAGGGWLVTNTFGPEVQTGNLRFIAQLTLPPGASITGTLNAKIATVTPTGTFNEILTVEHGEGLMFSTGNLTELGCTDPNAENYNPNATVDDGSCAQPADFNGDGSVDTQDILDLIGNLGCSDCDGYDLDGDGVVGIGDLLVILGVFGG